jgi:hypothetical protein
MKRYPKNGHSNDVLIAILVFIACIICSLFYHKEIIDSIVGLAGSW